MIERHDPFVPNVLFTLEWATARHGMQIRRTADGANVPYAVHLMEVMRLVYKAGFTGYTAMAAAALHDVVEDTNTSLKEVSEIFGSEVATYVEYLTLSPAARKDRELKKKEQTAAMHGCPSDEIRAIKVADKISNVARCLEETGWPPATCAAYAESSREVVIAAQCRYTDPRIEVLFDEFYRAYDNVQQRCAALAARQS